MNFFSQKFTVSEIAPFEVAAGFTTSHKNNAWQHQGFPRVFQTNCAKVRYFLRYSEVSKIFNVRNIEFFFQSAK